MPRQCAVLTCKTACSSSGAEGIRTPDLRRAKSGAYRRRSSPLFRNTCKSADFSVAHFVLVRRCSYGLVYYWCKWVSAQHLTHLALISAAVQRNKVPGKAKAKPRGSFSRRRLPIVFSSLRRGREPLLMKTFTTSVLRRAHPFWPP